MIRKIGKSMIQFCKFWMIGLDEEKKESAVTSSRYGSGWFPATKDHQYD